MKLPLDTAMLRLALIAVLLTPLPAVAADALAEADYDQLNIALTDKVVIPVYTTYRTTTAELASALDVYCKAPDEAGLRTVRRHADAVFDSWQRSQPIAIGPVMDGAGKARFEFWPDKRGTARRQMRVLLAEHDQGVRDAGGLAKKSVALNDLKALERVVFDDDLMAAGSDDFGCAYATSIARHQAGLAARLLTSWTGEDGFRRQIVAAASGKSDVYYDAKEVAQDYLKGLADNLDAIIDTKLEPAMGTSSDTARPRRLESWRSGRSLNDIRANLETARTMLATPGGFADLLTKAGSGPLAEGVVRSFDETIALTERIGEPLRDAVEDLDQRPLLDDLVHKVESLEVLTSGPLAQDTGLMIGFNASDGD